MAAINPRPPSSSPLSARAGVHALGRDQIGGILSGVTPASSILATDETIPPRLPPAQIIHPPEYFRAHFERNLEGALRDVAGVASYADAPLIRDPESSGGLH